MIEDFSIGASTVPTELFPEGALEYYTKKNMGWDYTTEEQERWQLNERGGMQGDYREGMQKKIANVIDCLRTEPLSKRAVIPIPFNSEGSETVDWTDQGQNKCCRELHLYLEDGMLKCTGIVRMQNANIMVKNIHFFATLVNHVAKELGVEVGEYTVSLCIVQAGCFVYSACMYIINACSHSPFCSHISFISNSIKHWITNLCHDRSATSC